MAKEENKKKEEKEKEEENSEQDEEVEEAKDFGEFLQEQRFSVNNSFVRDRTAPVLSVSQTPIEDLERTVQEARSEKKPEEETREIAYEPKNYNYSNYSNAYSPRSGEEMADTRKFVVGNDLNTAFIEDRRNEVNLSRLNMQQQQMFPRGQGESKGEYVEIKKQENLEDRGLPFNRARRRRERVLN